MEPMRQGTILLIEHDWRLGKLVRTNLEASGHVVMLSVSMQHGLELIEAWCPDLVVLDVDLPEAADTSLVAVLLARAECGGRKPGLILVASEPPDRQLLDRAGADTYLKKPFAALTLLHDVQRALDGLDIPDVCPRGTLDPRDREGSPDEPTAQVPIGPV
jgi:two-component system, OmpR family, KDP operon response regulator KdpE